MTELAWFVAGVAAAIAVTFLLRSQPARPRRARPHRPQPRPVTLVAGPAADDARRVALTLAEELATLVSGVEGRSHHLIEAAPNRANLPSAAEALLAAVQRLRTLHNKLVAFGRARTSTSGSTEVQALVLSLRDELQHMQLGLEVCWEPREGLPPINGAEEEVRDALLFLCAALLRAERGATHLSIQAEPSFDRDTPRVQLELALEWVAEAREPLANLFADPSFTLDLEAATNLITALGGAISITHLPGCSVRAVLDWPAVVEARPADAEAALAAPRTLAAGDLAPATHRYGGALVLEADPSIRAMLASELKATGRAVFACADGASARSFLEATPDRFELLIVDHHRRLDGDNALLATIRSLVPDLKVCVLAQVSAPAPALPGVHRIQKPFGVHELRRALATVLAG